jgi:hypothetical protein
MTMATTRTPCEGRETHHLGCPCHEAKRDAEVAALRGLCEETVRILRDEAPLWVVGSNLADRIERELRLGATLAEADR